MRILVTAIAPSSGISGVQRHAFNLVRCLLHCADITAVHLVLAPWQLHLPAAAGLEPNHRLHIETAAVGRSSIARNLWSLRELGGLARAVAADLIHLSYPIPFRHAEMPCPVVTTLHDLYPFDIPRNFGFPQVIVNRWILRSVLHQVDAIACVSQSTQSQLRNSRLQGGALIKVVPNCVEPGPASSARGPIRGWTGETFLLAVAQHRRNKNLALLLRSFHRLLAMDLLPHTARLVIVGMQGPETAHLHALAQYLDVFARVDFLEGLSEAELQWCYRHCAALVAPSFIEGFGLPVAEAQLAGCRVVCSDIPAHRELAGPQVRFVGLPGNDKNEHATHNDAAHELSMAIADALLHPKPAPEHLPGLGVADVAQACIALYQATLARQEKAIRGDHRSRDLKERQLL